MLTISVTNNIADTIRDIQGIGRHVRPAASMAVNRVANTAQLNLRKEIVDVFDRPKPYTVNAVFMAPSNQQTLTATVGLKDVASKQSIPASKYLLASIKGGMRRMKRFEKALQSVGVLPPGMVAVAGKAAQMDAYGNVASGQINQILAYFKAFPEAGYKANTTAARRAKLRRGSKSKLGYEYFVGRPGDGRLPLGIWKRVYLYGGTAIKPILIFVDGAIYERVLELAETVEFTVRRHFNAEFERAMALAITTAR
jgi:hypothetical protein